MVHAVVTSYCHSQFGKLSDRSSLPNLDNKYEYSQPPISRINAEAQRLHNAYPFRLNWLFAKRVSVFMLCCPYQREFHTKRRRHRFDNISTVSYNYIGILSLDKFEIKAI
jgi:hypothetical protein